MPVATRICPECNGKGGVNVLDKKLCTTCQGTGRNLNDPLGGTCYQCKGTGMIQYYSWFICRSCNGRGYI